MAGIARKCFVSMPMGRAFADVYESAILPAITENGLTPVRPEDLKAGSLLREGLLELIQTADLVIAVVSDEEQHSFAGFELGLATALKKPIILLGRFFREVPFDLQHIRFLSYNTEPKSLAQLRRDLTRAVRRIADSLAEVPSGPSDPAQQPTGEKSEDGRLAADYAARGDYSAALDLLLADITRLRTLGDHPALAAALNSASVSYQAMGRYEEALSALQEAFGLLASVGEPRQRATIAVNLANVLANTGDLDQARTFYREAHALAEETEDTQLSAEIMFNYAHLLYRMGDIDAAQTNYQYALKVFQIIGDVRAVAITQANLAALLQQRGDIAKAEVLFREALRVFDNLGDVRGRASLLHNLGSLQQSKGDFEAALSLFRESLHDKQQMGDLSGSAVSLAAIGHALVSSGRIAEGLETLSKAAKIQEDIGDRYGLTQTLFSIGIVSAQYVDASAAENVLERSLAMAVSIGAPQQEDIREFLSTIRSAGQSAE